MVQGRGMDNLGKGDMDKKEAGEGGKEGSRDKREGQGGKTGKGSWDGGRGEVEGKEGSTSIITPSHTNKNYNLS